MSVCVCMLSSANVMLPSLVGHQKPALAENQLQVRSLALSLSVRGPRWRECNHSARIPKSLTVVGGGLKNTGMRTGDCANTCVDDIKFSLTHGIIIMEFV